MKFQSNLILPLLIGLSACNWSGQKGYDSYFLDLINKANKNGDPNAAEEAYDYCQSILKLDNIDLPSGYIGQCGGGTCLVDKPCCGVWRCRGNKSRLSKRSLFEARLEPKSAVTTQHGKAHDTRTVFEGAVISSVYQ